MKFCGFKYQYFKILKPTPKWEWANLSVYKTYKQALWKYLIASKMM